MFKNRRMVMFLVGKFRLRGETLQILGQNFSVTTENMVYFAALRLGS